MLNNEGNAQMKDAKRYAAANNVCDRCHVLLFRDFSRRQDDAAHHPFAQHVASATFGLQTMGV